MYKFLDGLDRIQHKEIQDDKDIYLLRAVFDYLQLLLNDRKEALEKQIGNPKISFSLAIHRSNGMGYFNEKICFALFLFKQI